MKTRTRTQERLIERFIRLEVTLAGYARLVEVARAHDLEAELDRLPRIIEELQQERDDLIDECVDAGLGPDEVEIGLRAHMLRRRAELGERS